LPGDQEDGRRAISRRGREGRRGARPLAALVHLPERELAVADVDNVRSGQAIEASGEGPVALWAEGALVAVGRAGGGVIRPETVLPPA
jgi:hypothetical protein